MSKIKLTGESSGYVEISAGSNAGNNTLELPTSGTRLIASDNDGNVTIGGTLTYADVTNVDSIGVITARSGLNVTGGNVGIGTDNPTKSLSILSSQSVMLLLTGTTSTARIGFNVPTTTNNPTIGVVNGDDLQIRTGSEERLRVFSDGTIGIGSITSTTPVTPPTDILDGNVPGLSPVLKIHRNNEHVSAGTSIGLLISDRVNRGTNAFNPLVLENAHLGTSDYSGSMIKARRYNHGGYDGAGFEINVGNGDGLFNLVGGAHYNPADAKYSFDGTRGAAMVQFTDTGTQGVVRLWGSEGTGDPGIGVTFLQHYPPPTFYAHDTSVTLNNNATTKVIYTTEVFDTHSAYNTSNGKFTAPMSGYYWMHATLRINVTTNNCRYDMNFRINGSASVYSGGLNQQNSNDPSTMATVIMDLNKGDEVEVYADQNGGSNVAARNNSNVDGGSGTSHFTGYLVAPKFA